jgi:hypothetical protein
MTKLPKGVGSDIFCYQVCVYRVFNSKFRNMVMASDNFHAIHKKKLNCVKNYLKFIKQSELTGNVSVLVMKDKVTDRPNIRFY